MKGIYAKISIALFIVIWSFHAQGTITRDNTPDPQYARFADDYFQYSLLIPKEWHKSDFDLRYKRILVLGKGRYPRIKITATVQDHEERDKWQCWKDWYFADSRLMVIKIIEEKAFTRIKGLKGRLIVFEYKRGSKRFLQRMLLAQFNRTMLVIECSAPVKTFYTHAGIFDATMSSIQIH